MTIRVITPLLLTSILAACGGEDANPGIGVGDGLRGLANEPTLTTATGSDLSLNTQATGSIVEGSDDTYIFTATETGDVLVVLTSSVRDLDLSVSGMGVYEASESDDSFEQVYFTATANQEYRIDVESFYGDGSYTLKVVTPNRESMGLTSDEYLVRVNARGSESCSSYTYNYDDSYYFVVNWEQGYLLIDGERENFDSVVGNTATINYSESYSYAGDSYSLSGQAVLTVNGRTGNFTGTDDWTETYVEGGETETCTYSEEVSGTKLL